MLILRVRLVAARNLNLVTSIGYQEPYCILQLEQTRSTINSSKRPVANVKYSNPIFNQQLDFEITSPETARLFVTLLDKDSDDNEQVIGKVVIYLSNLRLGCENLSWYFLNNKLSEIQIGLTAVNFSMSNSSPNQIDKVPFPSKPLSNSLYHPSLPPCYPPSYPQLNTEEEFKSNGEQVAVIPAPNGTDKYLLLNYPSHYPLVAQPSIQQHPGPPYINNINMNDNNNQPNNMNHLVGASSPQNSYSMANPNPCLYPMDDKKLFVITPLNASTQIRRDFPNIAKGSFGIVYTGHVEGIKEKVAIKDMQVHNQKNIEDWTKEVTIMNQTRCPYVVNIFGYSTLPNTLTIVMEYLKKGSLYDVLHIRKEPISLLQRMRMARHCALGLAHLHACGVIHRDVKSMNILVSSDYSCKFTDFGCAKLMNNASIINTADSGTPLWMAPEVRAGHYDYSADIYSLGLVLYELFEKKLPYFDQARQTIVLPPHFQSSAVILRCISPKPEYRPSAYQLVNFLDVMITNVVTKVRFLLPPEENNMLKRKTIAISAKSKVDQLDLELSQLYIHLLRKKPAEVDALIDQAFRVVHQTPTPIPLTMHQVYPPQAIQHYVRPQLAPSPLQRSHHQPQ